MSCRAPPAKDTALTCPTASLAVPVQSLKSLKAALLKQTTTAAKAAALAAKQQQKAQQPAKPNKQSSKKRTAATAAISDEHTSSNGLSSDGDGSIDAGAKAAGAANRPGKRRNSRTLDEVSGPTWCLFQALTLQTVAAPTAGAATVSGPAAGAATALAGPARQPGQPVPAMSAPTDTAEAVPAGAAQGAAATAEAAGAVDAVGPGEAPTSLREPQNGATTAAAAARKHAQPVLANVGTMCADPTVCLQQLFQSCLQTLTHSSNSGGGGSTSGYDGNSSSSSTYTATLEALSNPAQVSTACSLRTSNHPAQQQQEGLQDWQMLPDLDSLVLTERTQAAAAGIGAAAAAGACAFAGASAVAEGAGADKPRADSQAAHPSQLQEPAPSDASTAPAHKPTAAAPPSPPPAAAAPLRQPFCISALLQQFDNSMQCSPNSQHIHLSQPAAADAGLIAGRFMLLSTAAADTDTLGGSQRQQQQMLLSEGGEVGLPSYMQKVIQQQPAQQHPSRPSPAASILASGHTAAALTDGEGGGVAAAEAHQPALACPVGASHAHLAPTPTSHDYLTMQRTPQSTSPATAAVKVPLAAAAVSGVAVPGMCGNRQQQQQQHEL